MTVDKYDWKVPVENISSPDLKLELEYWGKRFDDMHTDLDGMSGSPGEWMFERISEIETALQLRGDL